MRNEVKLGLYANSCFNQSITHVDLMVGSNQLDIDGETHDGRRIPLFRLGNWVSSTIE